MPDMTEQTTARTGTRWVWPDRLPALGTVLLAAVSFIPLLLTKPGEIGADTKTYLYLDPSRLLSRAAWMWDTNIGLGTVTHQNIGYLWPMGPYYWVFDQLGVPDWVAQRLWLGGIIFAAGMGVRFMLRELGWVGAGVTVASFSYALSPYLLHYGARISVILLPFAGLPWLIGISSRALRLGGWRWPAAFALVTLTVGGVNATSLILVMFGPLLWFVHSVWIAREVTLGHAIRVGLRITFLTAITSLWWVAGLALQGSYGIPILRYTETYYVVAHAALSTELSRGLGYWFFYGRDGLGAWLSASQRLTQNLPAMVLSFSLPLVALASGLLTRFRNRGYFALLAALGMMIAVGAHPWDSSSPYGAIFGAWTRSDAGLAFRSTPRALPLLVLGLSVMLAAGVAAISALRPGWHLPIAGALLLAICVNQWALFGGEMVDRNLKRDEELPEYWLDAAAEMNAGSHDTRVMEVPGSDFASYTWGNTVDPITPGLIDRPFVARELIPYGTPSSADLLNAVDVPAQQGTMSPEAIVPLAQLMGVGTIAHRGDIQYERFRTPRPRNLFPALAGAPGLLAPTGFGEGLAHRASEELPLDDEIELGTPFDQENPPAVSLFDLAEPRNITRAVSADSPTLMAGDGEGIVNWAATGALHPDRPILYSASYAEDTDGLSEQIAMDSSQLVVTDTNRRAARRWGSVRENDGYTEASGEVALDPDPADNRLDKFPGADDSHFTVSEQVGDAKLAASLYGNAVSYTPGDRAVHAMDGRLDTVWSVGAFDEVRGEFLEVTLDDPAESDEFTLIQAIPGGNRWITEVEISLDGSEPLTVALEDSSRNEGGQVIKLARSGWEKMRITITEANLGVADRYTGISGVGIAELQIPGVDPVTEIVRPPTDLLGVAGLTAIDRSLSYVFTRRHSNPSDVLVADEEPTMLRYINGGAGRSYEVFGKVAVSDDISNARLAAELGLPETSEGGLAVDASASLSGDMWSRPLFALDGDESTAWQTPINDALNSWIEVRSGTDLSFDSLSTVWVNDGLHSVPTKLAVSVDGKEPVIVDVALGVAAADTPRGTTEAVTLDLPPMSGSVATISVVEIAEANSADWFSGFPTVLPIGLAELGIGATLQVPPADTALDQACDPTMLEIDGRPLPLQVLGTVGELLDGSAIAVSGCEVLDLESEEAVLTTDDSARTNFDVNQIVLASAAGGGPGVNTAVEGPAPVTPPPETTSENPSRLTWDVEVTGAQEPYWLVLGQSLSPGFTATTEDGTDLGESQLVNGYANGWLVDPAEMGADAAFTIKWTPQRIIWIALALSGLAVLLCIALLIKPIRFLAGKSVEVVRSMKPRGVHPFRAEGSTAEAKVVVISGLGSGVLSLFAFGPAVGLATAILVAAAVWARNGQIVLRVVGIGVYGAAVAFMVAKQFRNDFVLDFNWMNQFETTHAWTLLAFALLAVDPLVTHLRNRPEPKNPETANPEPTDPESANPEPTDPETANPEPGAP